MRKRAVPSGMHVVLDSTVLVADLTIRGTAVRTLLSEASRVGHSVCVPYVVVEENVNRYRGSLESAVAGVDRALAY